MMSINIVSSEANIIKIATIAGGAAAAIVVAAAVAACMYCKRQAKRSAFPANVGAFNDIPFPASIPLNPFPREGGADLDDLESSYASTVDEDPSSFYSGR